MKERDIETVLLVSDSFHNARIRAMTKDLGLTPYVSATGTSPITGAARYPYLTKEITALGAGQLIGWDSMIRVQRNLQPRPALPPRKRPPSIAS